MSSFKYIKCLNKIKKVFDSCITIEQLNVAKIWCDKYKHYCIQWEIKEICNIPEEYFVVDNYIEDLYNNKIIGINRLNKR